MSCTHRLQTHDVSMETSPVFVCVCALNFKSRVLNLVVHKQHIYMVTDMNFSHLYKTKYEIMLFLGGD